MTHRLPITVLVATRNEEANISRCISSLAGHVERVIAIDSRSTDRTAELASECGAEVITFRHTGGYPRKRQWAIDNLNMATQWVMLIDADEVVPDELWVEIESAMDDSATSALMIVKGFHFMGQKFRFGGFSHSAVLVFRQGCARFEEISDERIDDGCDMEVHEKLLVDGRIKRLRVPLIHNDFKSLDSYKEKHRNYAKWEAVARHGFLDTGSWGQDAVKADLFGDTQEKRRFLKQLVMRMPFEPAIWFLYHYVVRLGFLEGRPGHLASIIRAQYVREVRERLRALKTGRESRS